MSQISALKRIITKDEHNKYKEIVLKSDNPLLSQIIIGRDIDCTYRISSIEISRKHACLNFTDDCWHITDLQSTNGLFVNARQLQAYSSYRLMNGDRISFGPPNQSEFNYQFIAECSDDDIAANISITSLPVIPIVTRFSTCDSSSSGQQLLPSSTVRFSLQPHVSGTISLTTTMPTRSGTNYHSNTISSSSRTRTASVSVASPTHGKRSQSRQAKQNSDSVERSVVVSDHEYSRSSIVIQHRESNEERSRTRSISSRRNVIVRSRNPSRKNSVNDGKYEELQAKYIEKEKQKLEKLKREIEEQKEFEKKRIKAKEEELKAKKKELEAKEREARSREKQINVMKRQLSAERKRLEERSDERKASSKRKDVDRSDSTVAFPQKRQCSDSQENQLEEIIDAELTCTICHELFVHAVNLNCSHTFCFACIEQWKKSNASSKECPICREPIRNQNRQLVLDNLIERLVAKMKPEQREHREKLVDERKKVLEKPRSSAAPRRSISSRGRIARIRPRLHLYFGSTDNDDNASSNDDDVSVIGIHFGSDMDNSEDSESESSSDDSSASSSYSIVSEVGFNNNNDSDSDSSIAETIVDANEEESDVGYSDDDRHSSSYVSVSSSERNSDSDSDSADSDGDDSVDSIDSVDSFSDYSYDD